MWALWYVACFAVHKCYLVCGRQRSLCLFDLPPQLLDGSVVFSQVLALLLLVQLDEVVHHPLVEVFTSKMGVSCDVNKILVP